MKHKIAAKTEIAYPISLEDLDALGKFHERELHPIMIAIHSLFPGVVHNSPSRSVMVTQHVPQHLVVSGIEPPVVMSGQEYEMGKYTFATRMPISGTIVKVIKRYRATINEKESVNGTPELTVIYRKEANGQYDVFHIAQWKSYHQYFGFENKTTSNMNLLRVGQQIPAGTKFADTPANTSDELYCYGVNLNHAAMDIPEVDEDGFIIARSALKKFHIKVYETREISFGREGFPVGMFSNEGDDEYKIMKEIGERVRYDGLLAASRPFRDLMAGVMMGPKELREVDHIFDNKVYTRETSISPELDEAIRQGQVSYVGGVVKDIKVIRTNDNNRILPPTMTGQLDKYSEAYRNYFKDILSFETEKLSELRKAGREPVINMTANLSSLLVQARGVLGYSTNRFAGPVSFQYRKNPMDEYTVTFVIEHELEPNLGWKLSSTNGDKGVIVGIWEDDRMPVDEAGNRAEVITSSNSTVGRSNWGRSFVPYFSAAARDVRKRLLAMSGLTNITQEAISLLDDGLFTELYNTLLLFYAIVSPRQFYWYNQKVVSKEKRVEHMYWCLKEVIRIYMPVDNPISDIDAVCHLEKHFPQTFGPLKYKTFSGKEATTEDPVRICPMYFLLLEKIADDGSSANFGKLQHHGILASQTKSEKYSQNFRHVHTRNTGEAEARLITFYANSIEAIAELHDRSNNPETMKTMANRLLRDPTPTNIDEIIDRNIHQYGGTRPLQFFQHFAMTQGFEIFYMTEEEAFKLGLSENFDAAV